MNTHRYSLVRLGPTALALLALAGCGSSDDTSANANPDASATPAAAVSSAVGMIARITTPSEGAAEGAGRTTGGSLTSGGGQSGTPVAPTAGSGAPTAPVSTPPPTPVKTPTPPPVAPVAPVAPPVVPVAPVAPVAPPAPPTSPPVVATVKKSIGAWTGCNGSNDDSQGIAAAFAAAKNDAFTLVVDCPVRLHVGTDIARAVFIDNGTTVEFTPAGKLTVDNTLSPAFVIANSSNITLTNWTVEYDASVPIDLGAVTGYENNGQFVAGQSPGGAFNNFRLTKWLSANRGITFDQSQGWSTSKWTGNTNICAIFYFDGDASHVAVNGMRVSAPATAGGNSFAPVVFSFNPGYKSNQVVNAKTPYTVQYYTVPHDLAFSNITLDGFYMGWVGSAQNTVIDTVKALRYGDLQDANGEQAGGTGKWFAPPHLIYLSYLPTVDPGLFNKNIQISNVNDVGLRVGHARDLGGNDPGSGSALSLKLGCVSCSVNNYTSARPDGLMDVLTSNGLTISNVTATYDSSFLNNLYPGWRFPKPPYSNVTFENVSLTDLASTTVHLPLDNAYQDSNQDIRMKNVQVTMNRWSGTWAQPFPTINGDNNQVSIAYVINAARLNMTRSIVQSMQTTIQAQPASVQVGAATSLKWSSVNANNCARVGAWSGSSSVGGSQTMSFAAPGIYSLAMECRNGTETTNASVNVVVTL